MTERARHLAERVFPPRVRVRRREAHRASPRRGQPVTLEPGGAVRVRSFECGARARALAAREPRSLPSCVVVLEVSAADDEVPSWLGSIDVVDARGGVHTARATRLLERVDAASVRVVVVLPSGIRPRGALLRVGAGRARLRVA